MSNPNSQDQGSLDQPQQDTQAEPGAYTTPGVVPPDQQTETVSPASAEQKQVAGGGAAPDDAPESATPQTPASTPATATATATAPAAAPTPTPSTPSAPSAPSGGDSDS